MTTEPPTTDQKMNEELIQKTRQWFHDKKIIQKSNPLKQLGKTQEELNETRDAVVQHKAFRFLVHCLKPDVYERNISHCLDDLKDGIGDTVVTLIGVCEMTGIDFIGISKDTLSRGYRSVLIGMETIEVLDDIQAHLLDAYSEADAMNESDNPSPSGILRELIGLMLAGLWEVASRYNFSLGECLHQAYDVISKRTGEVVDGVFIKDKEVKDEQENQ